MIRFAGQIRTARRALGMTQAQLAREAGVSLATVQNMEAGLANPSLKTLERILAALGLSLGAAISATDWDAFAAHGLPLRPAGSSEVGPTPESLRRLIRSAALEIRPTETDGEGARRLECYQALLFALRTAYPRTWDAWFARAPLIAAFLPVEPNGRLVKLRRIAVAALAKYL